MLCFFHILTYHFKGILLGVSIRITLFVFLSKNNFTTIMKCINIHGSEFQKLAWTNNVSPEKLETIVYKYYAETQQEDKFPSNVYIQAQIGNFQYEEKIASVRELWKMRHSKPQVFKTLAETYAPIQELYRFYPKGAVVRYRDAEGNYVVRVKQPVWKEKNTREKVFDENTGIPTKHFKKEISLQERDSVLHFADNTIRQLNFMEENEVKQALKDALGDSLTPSLENTIDKMTKKQIIQELEKIQQEEDDFRLVYGEDKGKSSNFAGGQEIQMAIGDTARENNPASNDPITILNDITNGTRQFNNLTEEENDVARRDRLLAGGEVACRLHGKTDREESQDARNERQEKQVEKWARQTGVWHDDALGYGRSFGNEIKGGQESHVYVNYDNKSVVKVKNTLQYHDLREFLDGIVLHNTLFPETAYKVLGFGNDGEGFVVILEQPFVKGEMPTQEQITEFLKGIVPEAEMYEKELKNGRYKTPTTLIHDISPRNAIITPSGNIAVIDGIIRPNVASEGKGGARTEDYSIGERKESGRSNEGPVPQFSISSRNTFTFYDGTTVDVPFTPNEQQADALNAMVRFAKSEDTSMTLSGYAGTGKTSLMEILAKKAQRDFEMPTMYFCATTNKAAAVLQSKVQKMGYKASTSYSLLHIRMEVDKEQEHYDVSQLRRSIEENQILPGSVIVIDEASMVNEEHYSDIQTVAKEKGLKIIYVGDKAQLPPVKESKVSKVFRDSKTTVIELTKVERTGDNAILKEATDLRNGKELSEVSSFNKEGKGVAYMHSRNGEEIRKIINRFTPGLKSNPDFFRILTYTNASVQRYNMAVRNALGYTGVIPRVGEPLMGYANWGYEGGAKASVKYRWVNSEAYQVTEVGKPIDVEVPLSSGQRLTMQAVPITVRDALGKTQRINFVDVIGNRANRQVAETLGRIIQEQLWPAWRAAATKQAKGKIIKQINAINDFLFINDTITYEKNGAKVECAKKVFDFGYAMTVHKSQGSTFTHVLVDGNNINTVRGDEYEALYDEDAYDVENSERVLHVEGDVEGEDISGSEVKSSESLAFGHLLGDTLMQEAPASTSDKVDLNRQLKYVAVTRATDTVTIISDNAKKEDSPLNHIDGQSRQATPKNGELSKPASDKGTIPPMPVTTPDASQMPSQEVWRYASSLLSPYQGMQIPYTPKGKEKQMYNVYGERIFNKEGKEVFTEDSVDRNKILANKAVLEKRAVVVNHKDAPYVVYGDKKIVSVTTGKVMQWGEENGDRKAILQQAERKFRNLIQARKTRGKEFLSQLIENLQLANLPVHNRAEMERFLRENPGKQVQEAQQAIAERQEMQTIREQAVKDGQIILKADGSFDYALAPNGKRSNLNERQWLQVRTKNFLNWFGDWVNDPANASKVVDENGEPLVVYHNTKNEFTKFSKLRAYFSRVAGGNVFGTGFYFSNSVGTSLGGINMPVFLSVKNPAEGDMTSMNDGMIHSFGNGTVWYAAKQPNQIKSATDNNGDFSTENDDIQMMVVGEKGARNLDAAEEATTRMDNLSVANEMEKAGKDALTIKQATGWERGADGKWRYEIPDITLKKDSLGDDKIREIVGSDSRHYITRDLSEVIDLSTLPPAYREELEMVGKIRVYDDFTEAERGSYITKDGKVIFTLNLGADKAPESILAHEFQHYIQDREGFQPGGNTAISIDALLKQRGIYDAYQQLLNNENSERNTLRKILSEDEKYKEYENTAKRVDQALDMVDLESASEEDVIEFIKQWVPNWKEGVNYDELAEQRKDELMKEHKDELEQARKNDEETYKRLQAIQDTLPSSYDAYLRLVGEVEARAAASRRNLTPEERRNSLFTDTMYQDVAKEDLIFLEEGLNGEAQMAIGKKASINNSLSSSEKENIRTLLKTINKTGTTLLDNGEGTMYLLDHADREDIESRNPRKEDGFNCRLKFSTEGYTKEDINAIKKQIENGNVRDQKSFDKWAESHLDQQGRDNSDSFVAEVRAANANNDRLHLQTSEREPLRGRGDRSGQEDFGTGFIKVYNNDGTNGPRYIPINTQDVTQTFTTPQGEVYGFVDKKGDIYLDETVISPEHPIHEYTHLWDRWMQKNNASLWTRGVTLMRKTSLWEEIANDENYGRKWKSLNLSQEKIDNLIASEVHARLTGVNGEAILDSLQKEHGKKGIIGRLKQWLLDFWKELKSGFSTWSQEEIDKLTLQEFVMMTVKDFADAVKFQDLQKKSGQEGKLSITPTIAADKKATAKGSIANKFIGFAEGIQGSSTADYARQAGDKANVGTYNPDDIVFVSVPGKRGAEAVRHREQQKTIDEAIKALRQGATLITDNAEYTAQSTYNEGEKALAEALKKEGAVYVDRNVDGIIVGEWKLGKQPSRQQSPLDINTISDKSAAYGVEIVEGSANMKRRAGEWQQQHPEGIVAYRKYSGSEKTFTPQTVEEGWIGNPFSVESNAASTVQKFYDWIVTGNNYGESRANEEFRQAVIKKILATPENSPILYYTELGRPSHATVIGYLVNNKHLLDSRQQPATKTSEPFYSRQSAQDYIDSLVEQGFRREDLKMEHHKDSDAEDDYWTVTSPVEQDTTPQQPAQSQQDSRQTPQAQEILNQFKGAVEAMRGYFETGGTRETRIDRVKQEFPTIPRDMLEKLYTHFWGGDQMTLENYRELWRYVEMVHNPYPGFAKTFPMILRPKAKQAPVQPQAATPLNTSLNALRDLYREGKKHVTFDEKTHTYYVDGKPVDYSVTQYTESIYGKPNIEGDYSHAAAIGRSIDMLAREFFAKEPNLNQKFPNLSQQRKAEVLSDLQRFRGYLDGRFGQGQYKVVTTEFPLVASFRTPEGDRTMAGTMDMVVVDKDGNLHIFDFKVKNHPITKTYNGKEVSDRRNYTAQLNLYKAILETNPAFKGKVKSLQLVWFDTLYPKLQYAQFHTDKETNQVTVSDSDVSNVPLENYGAFKTPALKKNIGESIIPLEITYRIENLQIPDMTSIKQARQRKVEELKDAHEDTVGDLGGDAAAEEEVKEAVVFAKGGMSFEDALKGQESFFTKEEIGQIKTALDGKNLQVMSVSRETDPAFFSKEIIAFLKKNAEKSLADPTRVTAMEIWSKHDGLPIKGILDACKKYRVAPMVSFSITGLGGTALEGGVMRYQDMLEKVGKLIDNGTLNPTTTTIRIDPLLPGITNMEDVKAIVQYCKSKGIRKFVASVMQSYGYSKNNMVQYAPGRKIFYDLGRQDDQQRLMQQFPEIKGFREIDGSMVPVDEKGESLINRLRDKRVYSNDRKVVQGIDNALASEGRTYDWEKYYGYKYGKVEFKPKQEYIDEIGKVLLELDKDPEITIQTCSFYIKGLKASACLDPLIIERIVGIDVTKPDGTYDRDTSRPGCMCYSHHGDFFKGQNKKCFSSCAYCYAAHSSDNKLNYYNEDGTLKDNDYTRTEYPTINGKDQRSDNSTLTQTEEGMFTHEEKPALSAPFDNPAAPAGKENAPFKEYTVEIDPDLKFTEQFDPITVDAEWKVPVMEELRNTLAKKNSARENQDIINKMVILSRSLTAEDYEKNSIPEEQRKALEEYREFNTQVWKLYNNSVDLPMQEVRHAAETAVNIISDCISEILQKPELMKKRFPDVKTEKDLTKVSRKELIHIIGIENLMEYAHQMFNPQKIRYQHIPTLRKAMLMYKNWDGVMFFAQDHFALNEGVRVTKNYTKGNNEIDDNVDISSLDVMQQKYDEQAMEEEYGDSQEHWQVNFRTIDVLSSMSEMVRQAIHQCYLLDENGNQVYSKWGLQVPERVQPRAAVQGILRWTMGAQNLDEMVDRLRQKQVEGGKTWLKKGDVVEVEVEGIGRITNRMR